MKLCMWERKGRGAQSRGHPERCRRQRCLAGGARGHSSPPRRIRVGRRRERRGASRASAGGTSSRQSSTRAPLHASPGRAPLPLGLVAGLQEAGVVPLRGRLVPRVVRHAAVGWPSGAPQPLAGQRRLPQRSDDQAVIVVRRRLAPAGHCRPVHGQSERGGFGARRGRRCPVGDGQREAAEEGAPRRGGRLAPCAARKASPARDTWRERPPRAAWLSLWLALCEHGGRPAGGDLRFPPPFPVGAWQARFCLHPRAAAEAPPSGSETQPRPVAAPLPPFGRAALQPSRRWNSSGAPRPPSQMHPCSAPPQLQSNTCRPLAAAPSKSRFSRCIARGPSTAEQALGLRGSSGLNSQRQGCSCTCTDCAFPAEKSRTRKAVVTRSFKLLLSLSFCRSAFCLKGMGHGQ